MAIEVRVEGTGALAAAVRDLRGGVHVLRAEVAAALPQATQIIRPRAVDNIRRLMPSGYAPILGSRTLIGGQVTRAGWVALRVTAAAYGRRGQRDLPAINRGTLRHPVFGNRRVWRAQRVPPGVVDRAVADSEADIADVVDRAISRAAERIERG